MVENNDNTGGSNEPKKRSRLFGGRKKTAPAGEAAAAVAQPVEAPVAEPAAEAKTGGRRPAAKKAADHVSAASPDAGSTAHC